MAQSGEARTRQERALGENAGSLGFSSLGNGGESTED